MLVFFDCFVEALLIYITIIRIWRLSQVFIGRPALWGLAHSGEAGVKRVLDILLKEFQTVMGLTGLLDRTYVRS